MPVLLTLPPAPFLMPNFPKSHPPKYFLYLGRIASTMKNLSHSFPLLVVLITILSFSCQDQRDHSHDGHGTTDIFDNPDQDRLVIYQLMTRLFSNTETTNKTYGTIAENGVGKFNGINDEALSSLRGLGVTHVWLTGVLEHATMTGLDSAAIPADDADVVKGRAGSPYAIKDYYDVAPALAENPAKRMTEFAQLLKRIHGHGMKAVIDFVPNHVARGYHSDALPNGAKNLGADDQTMQGFAPNNNFYYLPGEDFKVPNDYDPLGPEKAPGEDGKFDESPAKVTGNNVFSARPNTGDWFETVKLNYGVEFTDSAEVNHFDPVPDTWFKMRDILLFWAGKGVDGFRCDMAEMVPVEFWEWGIAEVKKQYPKVIFIAEIYNPARYHDYAQQGGFDFLYDKVGLYDRIRELMSGKGDTRLISEALAQSKGIEGKMLRFLENHDEQRIASAEFAGGPWVAVPGMALSALLGTGPTMIYFGQEVGEPGHGSEGFQGEDGRTTIFDYWGVPEHQKWMNHGQFDGGGLSEDQKELRKFYGELLRLSRYHEAFRTGKFMELPWRHEKVYAFLRFTETERVLVVVNFDVSETVKPGIQIPREAWKAMGLSPVGPYQMVDLLLTDQVVLFEAEDARSKTGLQVELPPESAFVLEIEAL